MKFESLKWPSQIINNEEFFVTAARKKNVNSLYTHLHNQWRKQPTNQRTHAYTYTKKKDCIKRSVYSPLQHSTLKNYDDCWKCSKPFFCLHTKREEKIWCVFMLRKCHSNSVFNLHVMQNVICQYSVFFSFSLLKCYSAPTITQPVCTLCKHAKYVCVRVSIFFFLFVITFFTSSFHQRHHHHHHHNHLL